MHQITYRYSRHCQIPLLPNCTALELYSNSTGTGLLFHCSICFIEYRCATAPKLHSYFAIQHLLSNCSENSSGTALELHWYFVPTWIGTALILTLKCPENWLGLARKLHWHCLGIFSQVLWIYQFKKKSSIGNTLKIWLAAFPIKQKDQK